MRPPADPDRLFSHLAGCSGLLLAVSGGPDSTALMVLADRWRRNRNARDLPALHVAVVDHGLRAESAREAEQAADNARTLGFPVGLLHADVQPDGNVQEAARRARYRCLVEAARRNACEAIVTAHHMDDQAETVLLRLLRGSGLFGLAGMAETVRINGCRLVRPLLGVWRDTLLSIAEKSELPIADDPSNRDFTYDRVWVREILALESSHLPGREELVALAARARRTADAIDARADELLAAFSVDAAGQVSGPLRSLVSEPDVIVGRALWRIVRAAGGHRFGAPGDKIQRLHRRLRDRADRGLRQTLGGVIIDVAGQIVRFRREAGRKGLETSAVAAGDTLVWDGRFRIRVPRAARPEVLSIGPLANAAGFVSAGNLEKSVVGCMPGLFRGGHLIAAPDGAVVARPNSAPADGKPDPLAVTCIVEEAMRDPRAIRVEDRRGGVGAFDDSSTA